MPAINFTDQQVQQLQNILGEIPWKIAHPLLVAIALSTGVPKPPLETSPPPKGNSNEPDRHKSAHKS